jgi:hypothetical protein
MGKRSIKIKLLAAFVVVFVCLNANGAVCVAYCQSLEMAANEQPEHCPLKKAAAHCDKSSTTENEGDVISVSAGKFDCCPITVNFFAAPIEKNSTHFTRSAVVASSLAGSIDLAFRTEQRPSSAANYRGPPLRDRRELRIKQCILRI